MKPAYLIAGVAALGIAVAIANWPAGENAPASAAASTVSYDAPGELTLAVPTMHCQYSCFPKVKEVLEGSPEIAAVQLAPQQDDSVLDHHAVIVHYHAGFNPDQAIAKLDQAGFTGSSIE